VTSQQRRFEGAGLKIFFDVEGGKTIVDKVSDVASLQGSEACGRKEILPMRDTGNTRQEVKDMEGRN
jgi:hypothetical protein